MKSELGYFKDKLSMKPNVNLEKTFTDGNTTFIDCLLHRNLKSTEIAVNLVHFCFVLTCSKALLVELL